jgi:hypothetical protein
MSSVPIQVLSHIIVTNIGPILLSMVSSAYSMYSVPVTTPVRQESDAEHDLDQLQMDQLIKWMNMLFDDSGRSSIDVTITQKAYKQELYSIYVGIVSDYKQYQQWKQYNESLWVLSSYRKKNTKGLAKKILGDMILFKEGLQMFSMMH